jgi:predicted heme/steroid binding protein
MAQNFASIQGVKENATDGDYASAMLFMTRANAANPAERMRIASDGLVTIGAAGGTGMRLAVNGTVKSFSGGFQFPDGTTQASAAINSQWGQSGSSIFYSSGNVGIGTNTPAFPLAVNGVVQSLAGGFKFPDGTTQASAAINSQWGQSASSIFYSAGNVGIGTNAPATPLAVNGVVHSLAGGFKFPDGTTQTTAASGQGSSFWGAGTQANSIFYSAGNVGVGTNNPGGPLNVVAGGGLNALFTATGNDGFIRVNSTVAVHPYADFALSGTSGAAYGEIRVGDDNAWRNLVLLNNGGAVGIGTNAPAASLHVRGGATTSGAARRTIVAFDASPSAPGVGGGISFGGNYSATNSTTDFANIWGIKEVATDNDKSGALLFGTTSNTGTPTERMRIASDGVVTIAGSGTGTRLNVNGDINVAGNINAKYQDMAEWVPAAEMLPAGTVVVLDPSVSNQVMSSTVAYATTVAGVVSDHPGILLGERGASKVQVATTGRVKVKVDATKGAVHIGDLLVTSDEPGTAMKSQPIDVGGMKIHRPGPLIGKALEPLAGGQGEILVLLSLQ